MKIKDNWMLYLAIAILVAAAGFAFYKNKTQEGVMGVNLPDRCVMFTQIASRSVKDNVKIYPGKVYSFSVLSSVSIPTYFQLYDQVNLPLHGAGSVSASPSFSIPLGIMDAGGTPLLTEHTFPMPMSITASGITFAISEDFAYFSSGSLNYKDFVVNICYY